MICAYCGRDKKGSKEHIISSGVLDIFPECFITKDNIRGNMHLSDPMVKDVCEECNNEKISYIDAYAKKIISKYFIKKYDKDYELEFIYNYTLIQKILLKYAYNDLRSHKEDVTFFTKNVLDFLINKNKIEPLRNVTVLTGLAINTSPAPDFIFGNDKIRWSKNPVFLGNSIIQNLDCETGEIMKRNENPCQEFKNMIFSYSFRFNSVQFLLICWDENITDEDLNTNNIILKCQYPYTILDYQGKSNLSRCTSEITYHFENLIDVSWGQGIFDSITHMRGTYSEESQKYLKSIEKLWEKEEEKLSKNNPR